MEITMISETEQIKLKALALHHALTRYVGDDDVSEVRLSRLRAQGCKFRAVKVDYIFIFRMLVFKSLKQLRRIIRRIRHSLAAQERDALKF